MQMILSIVVLFAVFYFFMIRPEKKRKKQAEELRSSLSTGEKIVTIGGMMGTIVNVTDESITFETGEDRVRIEVAKWAVSKKTK
ncbi:MAG: preprotein translocase subunit YajC [Clostridiales bacterium]|nr:preprotein translocase subunit YajC [Clostridiales bacterium]